jgi:cell division protein FtsB
VRFALAHPTEGVLVFPTEPQRIIEAESQPAGGQPGRPALAQRALLWAVLVICAALLIASISEAWVRHNVEQQVTAASARNAALRQDVAAARQAVAVARSPATIEREARAWGFVRPGDHPVIVVTPAPGH